MKNRLKKYSLLLMVLLGSIFNDQALAVVPLPVLHKTMVKTFDVAKNDQVVIDNQYGDVEIKTWARKSVRFVITISAQTENTSPTKTNRVHVAAARDQH